MKAALTRVVNPRERIIIASRSIVQRLPYNTPVFGGSAANPLTSTGTENRRGSDFFFKAGSADHLLIDE
jgi:hypothetical protein